MALSEKDTKTNSAKEEKIRDKQKQDKRDRTMIKEVINRSVTARARASKCNTTNGGPHRQRSIV